MIHERCVKISNLPEYGQCSYCGRRQVVSAGRYVCPECGVVDDDSRIYDYKTATRTEEGGEFKYVPSHDYRPRFQENGSFVGHADGAWERDAHGHRIVGERVKLFRRLKALNGVARQEATPVKCYDSHKVALRRVCSTLEIPSVDAEDVFRRVAKAIKAGGKTLPPANRLISASIYAVVGAGLTKKVVSIHEITSAVSQILTPTSVKATTRTFEKCVSPFFGKGKKDARGLLLDWVGKISAVVKSDPSYREAAACAGSDPDVLMTGIESEAKSSVRYVNSGGRRPSLVAAAAVYEASGAVKGKDAVVKACIIARAAGCTTDAVHKSHGTFFGTP